MWPATCQHAMDVPFSDGSIFCAKCFGEGISSSGLATHKVAALQELKDALSHNPELEAFIAQEFHYILIPCLTQALAECRDEELAGGITEILLRMVEMCHTSHAGEGMDLLENLLRHLEIHLEMLGKHHDVKLTNCTHLVRCIQK